MEKVPDTVSLTGPSVIPPHHPGEAFGVDELPGRAGVSSRDLIKGPAPVLIDRVAHDSCSTLTQRVRGKQVTTTERFERPSDRLHPIQQAFIDELGPQCGCRTPGQVMSAVALLNPNPNPTRQGARRAMSGYLCRCGANDHHPNSIMRAGGPI